MTTPRAVGHDRPDTYLRATASTRLATARPGDEFMGSLRRALSDVSMWLSSATLPAARAAGFFHAVESVHADSLLFLSEIVSTTRYHNEVGRGN